MTFVPINLSDGQVSGVSDLSPAASSVVNFDIDDAGVNMPRGGLAAYTASGLTAAPLNGLVRWNGYIVGAHTDGSWWALPETVPHAAIAASDATSDSKLVGGKRPQFALGATDIYACAGEYVRRWNRTRGVAQKLSSWRSTHLVAIGDRLVSNDIDDPQFFKWSAQGEGNFSSWPAANASDPAARPDAVVGIFDNMNELWVFGTDTLQCYQVGNDPLNPFDLISTTGIGLIAPYSPIPLDEQFVFLDNRLRIVISNRRTQQSISDAIQKDLRGLSNPTDAWGYRLERGQMSQIVYRFPTDQRTFVYDLRSQKWREDSYYAGGHRTDFPAGAYVYWQRYNYHLVGSSLSTGGLYTFGSATSDLGNPLVCERVTGWHDHGSKTRKRSLRVRCALKRGTATASGQGAGALEFRTQDDDKDWSQWRSITVGGPEDFASMKDVATGGVFRRRRYHFRYSTTEAFALAEAFDDIQDTSL